MKKRAEATLLVDKAREGNSELSALRAESSDVPIDSLKDPLVAGAKIAPFLVPFPPIGENGAYKK